MNIIKIIKSYTLLTLAAMMTVSCSDYLDVDDNPNNQASQQPGLTLPVAQRDLAALNATQMTYLGLRTESVQLISGPKCGDVFLDLVSRSDDVLIRAFELCLTTVQKPKCLS